jgi:hypothetical protein
MIAQPLTEEERAKIYEWLGDGTDNRCSLNQYWSQKVLASEAYWRSHYELASAEIERLRKKMDLAPYLIVSGEEKP